MNENNEIKICNVKLYPKNVFKWTDLKDYNIKTLGYEDKTKIVNDSIEALHEKLLPELNRMKSQPSIK